MCKSIRVINQFEILQTSKDYVIRNNDLEYKNHAHIKRLDHAQQLIKLIIKGIKPNSRYMQIAAQRLLGEEYSNLISKHKPMYCNVNKGVRK